MRLADILEVSMTDLFTKEASIRKPPSLAFKTVTNFLEQFQDSLPSHIDRSVMPTSMSGGNQVYLQGALKFPNQFFTGWWKRTKKKSQQYGGIF